MASNQGDAGVNNERISFAKIAAAGTKPPNTQSRYKIQKQQPNSSSNENASESESLRTNGIQSSSSSAQPQKLVEIASRNSKDAGGPEVLLHRAVSESKTGSDTLAPEGFLTPSASDDNGTQLSSFSDSAKAPSIDGKSVASGTTFALDEKESLRPDDSASLKAVDDEDIFSPPSSGLPGSHIGSDDGMRAFRDQLREISSMGPPHHEGTSQSLGGSNSQGVLYMPSQGSGVGSVPAANDATASTDSPPDPKLLEALESPRDRIWVLKLEQDIFDFVKDPKESSLNLPQCNAYHRMLAHKIADYYMLGHLVDDSASAVRLFKTPNCRIPPPLTGITTPSTAASTPPPTAPPMKILRRDGPAIANGSNGASKTTSENGSEDDGKPKLPASREEREARYEAARLRIMGSAKPVESAEVPKKEDESRCSSTTGKKKKKQRSDSEDGFEARSAYSAFYAQPYTSNGFGGPSYGYSGESSISHGSTPASFAHQGGPEGYQQYPNQTPPSGSWPTEGFQQGSGGQNWAQNQQPPYDLSGDFQRAMSLQSPGAQNPNAPPGYNPNYPQQYYGGSQQPQQWPQSQYPAPGQPPANYNVPPGYPNRPVSSQGGQSYQYGQLPSQTYPGRPANNLEHPLPGSWKSNKHFNPQIQSFVPGPQPGAMPFQPYTPQGAAPPSGYGSPQNMTVHRQNSGPTQSPGFASPHHSSPGPNSMGQPMMHPLPQPVFPRQSSPSLPLPRKPNSAPQRPGDLQNVMAAGQGASPQNGSTIAKWGTPASLPAKPPPSVEQIQRQPSYNTAAAARVPSGGSMPNFGSMPPMNGGYAVNGSGNKRSG